MKIPSIFQRLKNELNLFRFAFADTRRYQRTASGFGGRASHHLSKISVVAHCLERGLALPNPRPQFAQRELVELNRSIKKYFEAGGDPSAGQLRAARGALDAYCDFHRGLEDKAVPAIVHEIVAELCARGVNRPPEKAGVTTASRAEVLSGRRRSIRIYEQTPVSHETALEAVRLGQAAPSVCNRQSGRVHLFLTPERVAAVTACQVGCGGFRESIPAVAVITSDLRTFDGCKERYQGWIDGGMFLMQFLNGLHAVGLGGCPLNWSVMPDRDNELRRVANIPDHERIVALVSFGNLPEIVRYAASPRLPVESVCTFDTISIPRGANNPHNIPPSQIDHANH